jgi:CheY-like chemotaxis protein
VTAVTIGSAAEQAGKRSESTAEELASLKQHFLASLNHEIRTPLSGVLGMADLLLETALDPEQREYVNSARECAQSLLGMLSSALEYAALMAGTALNVDAEFSLRETLEVCAKEHAARAEAKGVIFEYTACDEIPEVLLGDALRVRQVVNQLLSNAVKFTERGRINLGCSCESSAGQRRMRIEVRDTGIGIQASELTGIFESFQQVQRGLVRSYPGLGLGLPIALKLAQMMGGSIEAESEPGQGSTFRCYLPLRLPPDAFTAEEPKTQSQQAARRLLVVEDNPISRKVVCHILTRADMAFDAAQGGRAALEATAARQYDLILMDLQMPEMDGLEASAAIRRMEGYKETPILAFTASAPDECRQICFEHGLQGYLPKPVQQHELIAAIRKYIG